MDVSISGLTKNIGAYFQKMSNGRKMALAISAVLLIVGAVVLTKVLDNASYTVLYRGLDASENVEVVNLLNASGVDYRLESDGTILVPRTSEAMVRMQLAAEGFPSSTLGYDIFTSQSDLMTTDYEKKQYLIFQLQDRLQASLKTLSGVRDAIVTLNVADSNTYVLKSQATQSSAAVVLDLYPYADLGKKQIRGIEELVAKSVPGLTRENVIIVDGDGTVLNDAGSDFGADLASSQIEVVNQINALYEDKIAKFLEPVFGSDGVSVSVNVKMSFKQKNTQQTIYTPVVGDTSGILSRQQVDRQSTNGGKLSGGVAGTETNVGVPSYQNEDDDRDRNDGSASESYTNEFLVNQVVENALDNGGQIEDMTVSMMINSRELAAETLEKYREMVAYGVGIPPEKVFITYAEFLAKPETPVFTDTGQITTSDLMSFLPVDVLIYGGVGLGVLILLLIVLLILRNKARKRRGPAGSAAIGADDLAEGEEEEGEGGAARPSKKAPVPGEIVLSETREQGLKRQVREFAAANPEIVAQLLRSWMKEDSAK